jgi:hypothetical protein
MNWQSIDTAPYDELILLYGMHNGEPYCWLGRVSKGYGATITWDGAIAGVTPTHWTDFVPPQ